MRTVRSVCNFLRSIDLRVFKDLNDLKDEVSVRVAWFVAGAVFAAAGFGALRSIEPAALAQSTEVPVADASAHRELLDRYCVTCHNQNIVEGDGDPASPLVGQLRAVGLTLDTLDIADVGARAAEWEKVVRKLRGGVMPPAGRPRPDAETGERFLTWLEGELDRSWALTRDPGRTATLHRLNRTEYRNAIRDLLAVEIDAVDFLPADDSSFGFDNIGGVLKMSQSLMERYLGAARTISRLAVGSPPPAIASDTYQAAQDLPQHGRVEELPFGTRGGLFVEHLFSAECRVRRPDRADRDARPSRESRAGGHDRWRTGEGVHARPAAGT